MNTLEADLDLLAACRTREAILDDIERAGFQLHNARMDAILASVGVLAAPADPPDVIAVLGAALNDLAALDRRIAEAAAHHLLHPAPPAQPFMVLRPGSRT